MSDKRSIKMTRDIRENENENKNSVKDCNCSAYTMATVAGCILLCLGIIIYALVCA